MNGKYDIGDDIITGSAEEDAISVSHIHCIYENVNDGEVICLWGVKENE